jgi:hypothetical protein
MAFSYSTVEISSVEYSVIVTPAQITTRLGTRLGAGPTAWTALSSGDKDKVALMATRVLDRVAWDGDKTDAANDHAWPRSGLLDRNGVAVSSSTIPEDVLMAGSELAAAIAQDAALYDRAEANAGGRVQSLSAGPTSVSFFRASPGASARLPFSVRDLVSLWFAGASSPSAGVTAYGTERPSAWSDGDDPDATELDDDDDRYDFGGGLG